MELTTTYCGLKLKNPLMPGASPMADDLDTVRLLEDAGASAIVLRSLFEEQIINRQLAEYHAQQHPAESFAEALSYFPEPADYRLGPDEYLEQITRVKNAVGIPVIASLNGSSDSGWADYAKQIEQAGADALELNTYEQSFGAKTSTQQVEDHITELVRHVRDATALPLAVKLLPLFAGLGNFVERLHDAGADGAILFNRTYEPKVDLEELDLTGAYPLSAPHELPTRLRWLGLTSPDCALSLACSGGVYTAEDALSAIMCGADAVQMVSALLRFGPDHLKTVIDDVQAWVDERGYQSMDELRGSMNTRRCPSPWAYTRALYIKTLHSWRPSSAARAR